MTVADHMRSFLAENEIEGVVFVSHCNNKGAVVKIRDYNQKKGDIDAGGYCIATRKNYRGAINLK